MTVGLLSGALALSVTLGTAAEASVLPLVPTPASTVTAPALPHVTGQAAKKKCKPVHIAGHSICANLAEYKQTKSLMQVDPLDHHALVKKLGDKTAANDVYVTMVAATADGAPALKKLVPFPDWNAKSRKKYAKSKYQVYWMFAPTKPPEVFLVTWKYGITRQKDPKSRPERQLPACDKYFDDRYFNKCDYKWIWIGYGWFQARSVEAAYTLAYALQNGGKCPPGMPACV